MSIKENLVNWYKKLLKISIDLTNLVLTFLLYFFGVSISYLLWRFSRKKQNPKDTYWQKPKPLPKKLEEYYDQY